MFKRFILQAILFSCCIAISGCSYFRAEQHVTTAQAPLDAKGKPSATLLELLRVLDVQHDGILKTIVEQTQKQWMRPANKERWEVEDVFAAKRNEVMPLLEKLGFIYEIRPQVKQYRYAILFGATIQRMRMRLAYLIEQWKAGVRPDSIVVLVGQRKRSPEIETDDVLLGKGSEPLAMKKDWHLTGALPETETDMAKLIFEQAVLPAAFAKIPVTFIDTPMQQTDKGTMRRPNTDDTIIAWLQTKPEPGTCLAISNQPYCLYQHSMLRGVVPDTFVCETIGSADSGTSVTVCIDSVARFLFGEHKRLSKQ